MANEALQIIINNCLELAFAVIAAVVTGVIIPKLSSYIESKTENEDLQFLMDELEKTAISSVNYVEQTMVKQIKEDGRWDTESQKAVLHEAYQVMMDGLSTKTSTLVEQYGLDISQLAVRYLESAIAKSKQKG